MGIIEIMSWDLDYLHPTEVTSFTPNINCHICNGVEGVKQGEITTEKTQEKHFWRICSECLEKGWSLPHRELMDWTYIIYLNKLTKGVEVINIDES